MMHEISPRPRPCTGLGRPRPARHGTALFVAAAILLSGCSAESDSNSSPEQNTQRGADMDFRRPVVVELYQSQGCSSCPPANDNLAKLADKEDLLPLNFAVTYWDRLGWKDSFAQPAFTERQWDYARAAGRKNVATPQVIINGGAPINGRNMTELKETITARGAPEGGPDIHFSRTANGGDEAVLAAGQSPASPATVWLVRYDPRPQEVAISAGENNGRTLPHRNIVSELTALGEWKGAEARFTLAKSADPALQSAIFVQQGKGGPIIASAKLDAHGAAKESAAQP